MIALAAAPSLRARRPPRLAKRRRRAGHYAGADRFVRRGLARGRRALISPVDAVSGELFSVHMVQHELLMIVAAPLLVFSSPLLAFLWTLGPPARRSTMHVLRRPALVTIWER